MNGSPIEIVKAEMDYRIERLTGRARPGVFMRGTNSPRVIERWRERRRLREEARAARKKPPTGHRPIEG